MEAQDASRKIDLSSSFTPASQTGALPPGPLADASSPAPASSEKYRENEVIQVARSVEEGARQLLTQVEEAHTSVKVAIEDAATSNFSTIGPLILPPAWPTTC